MNWIQCALVNAGKKEIVLHKATGSAVTARRYGSGVTCFGHQSPWEVTEALVPSALSTRRNTLLVMEQQAPGQTQNLNEAYRGWKQGQVAWEEY